MNDNQSADSGHRGVRRWAVRLAAVTVPVLALSALAVGTAFAHDEDAGFSPTQPVDGFSDHWQKHHKDKDFTHEPETITSDPEGYVEIHQEMADDMLGH